eukprot:1158403-Pelagomonas_calceolata.AAC.1
MEGEENIAQSRAGWLVYAEAQAPHVLIQYEMYSMRCALCCQVTLRCTVPAVPVAILLSCRARNSRGWKQCFPAVQGTAVLLTADTSTAIVVGGNHAFIPTVHRTANGGGPDSKSNQGALTQPHSSEQTGILSYKKTCKEKPTVTHCAITWVQPHTPCAYGEGWETCLGKAAAKAGCGMSSDREPL